MPGVPDSAHIGHWHRPDADLHLQGQEVPSKGDWQQTPGVGALRLCPGLAPVLAGGAPGGRGSAWGGGKQVGWRGARARRTAALGVHAQRQEGGTETGSLGAGKVPRVPLLAAPPPALSPDQAGTAPPPGGRSWDRCFQPPPPAPGTCQQETGAGAAAACKTLKYETMF